MSYVILPFMVNKMASYYTPLQRPDGRWYRPRKAARAELLVDENGAETRALIIRCDHYEVARRMAVYEIEAFDRGCMPWNPQFGWWRQGIRDNERYWEYDEARGAPGYMFDIVYR